MSVIKSRPVALAQSDESVRVSIVRGFDELMACMAIRGAAFLGRGEPFAEEFDENDLISTTHLIARRGPAPIGTMRIRILTAQDGGIASWERLAILPNAGSAGTKALLGLAKTARAYCEFKGLATVVGAVENDKLLKFWQKHGFRLMDVPPSVYNNIEYRQVRLTLREDAVDAPRPDGDRLAASLNGSIEPLDFDRFLAGAL
jgi:hypothetical protein